MLTPQTKLIPLTYQNQRYFFNNKLITLWDSHVYDANRNALAQRIHAAILVSEPLIGKLISVVRPVR
ncbi:MAG: hypothetical protein KME29_10935 [Calothrix sp. FI2-JRJ7]|nr:hypothetical protein [Calothrix sp. FI2-JRJ7]